MKALTKVGAFLIVVGFVYVALTLYQVKVGEAKDYHMQITTGEYEWRSRSLLLTTIGVVWILTGVICIVGAIFEGVKQDEHQIV